MIPAPDIEGAALAFCLLLTAGIIHSESSTNLVSVVVQSSLLAIKIPWPDK